MKKKLYSLLTALLIASIMISPVYAGGTSIKVGLGSLVVDITAWGVGSSATAYLKNATGIPLVWCIAPGDSNSGNNNVVPGQNPVPVTAPTISTNQWTDSGKGKFTTRLTDTTDFGALYSPSRLGCQNDNWIAKIYFVQWTSFTVTILNAKNNIWYDQTFSCITTYIPNYTPGDSNTFNDGTINCTPDP